MSYMTSPHAKGRGVSYEDTAEDEEEADAGEYHGTPPHALSAPLWAPIGQGRVT